MTVVPKRRPEPIRRRAAEVLESELALMTGAMIYLEGITDIMLVMTEENLNLSKRSASNTL